jgi:hypothetical protein
MFSIPVGPREAAQAVALIKSVSWALVRTSLILDCALAKPPARPTRKDNKLITSDAKPSKTAFAMNIAESALKDFTRFESYAGNELLS